MAAEIVMPALEMAQDSGKLIRWLKREGDFVSKGEPLMEIETDKITVEIEAPASGVLSGISAQAGDTVPVGKVIGLLLTRSEAPTLSASPVARRMASAHGVDLTQIGGDNNRIGKADVLAFLQQQPALRRASPKARRLATERKLNLAELTGSGPGGALLAADIPDMPTVPVRELPAPPAIPAPTPVISDEYKVVTFSGMRKIIAERLQASYQTAPHIALTLSVDMTEALRLFERLKSTVEAQTGYSLTLTAVLSKLVSTTLLKHPRLNTHLIGEEMRQYAAVHLGIAVALDDGLVVPVIRNVERKGVAAIQAELHDLGERARARKLKADEIKGSTFTLSNLGMFGIEQFTAILNPPEVGILSVGVVQETPVGVNGQLALRPMMRVTLNVDHRAVDGAVAAAFLKTLREALENPYLLLA